MLVTGTGPLGCVPAELAQRSVNGQCAVEPQQAATIFNPLLMEMVADLNQELGSDIFVVVNAMQMQNDFINNPQSYGTQYLSLSCPDAHKYKCLSIRTGYNYIYIWIVPNTIGQ